MRQLAWAVVSLGLLTAVPAVSQAQDSTATVQLGRNYPNPFNPETTIPFTLERPLWDDGRPPVVTLRIYNVLAQLVAIPILQGSGELLDRVTLSWNGTGNYSAYWDGRIFGRNDVAASGVYIYQLTVDGETFMKKMTIVK